MKWNEFYKALNAGTIAPVYLFTGPEEYVKREALQALRDRLAEKFTDCDVELQMGGQPLYYYLIAVE